MLIHILIVKRIYFNMLFKSLKTINNFQLWLPDFQLLDPLACKFQPLEARSSLVLLILSKTTRIGAIARDRSARSFAPKVGKRERLAVLA